MYDREFRELKRNLYQQLTDTNEKLSPADILKFHHSEKDLENGFIINRNNQLMTFSVTQIVLTEKINTFTHADILDDKLYRITANEFSKKSFL